LISQQTITQENVIERSRRRPIDQRISPGRIRIASQRPARQFSHDALSLRPWAEAGDDVDVTASADIDEGRALDTH
jgi:hypothetical protein